MKIEVVRFRTGFEMGDADFWVWGQAEICTGMDGWMVEGR